MKAIYQDKQSIFQVLGCLLKQPDLLNDEKNYLTNEDFVERFHKIVFSAIQNLHSTGVEVIDFIAIDNYLNHFPAQYANFNENNGLEYLQKAIELSEIDNFKYYYTRVKKFSLLRKLEDFGIDISDIYRENMSVQDLMSFDELSLDGILEEIEKRFIEIKDQFLLNYGAYGQQAGKNIFKLIENLKQAPEIGSPLPGTILNTITRGARLRKLYLYSAPTGLGKALANGTKVLTPNGYKNIESFSIGDEIFGEDGEIYHIKGVFPQGQKEIYEIEFSNSAVVQCCNEHLWNFQTNNQRYDNPNNWQTKTLQEIIDTEPLYKQEKENKRWRLYLPIIKPLKFNKKELPIAPYTMGALLGDGGFREFNQCTFTNEDLDIVARVNSELGLINSQLQLKKNSKIDYEIKQINRQNKSLFHQILQQLNLRDKKSNNKFIPDIYKYSTIEDRFALLQGLIDTDGTCNGTSYDFITVSKQLCDDLKFVCESLGLVVKYSTKKTFYYKNGQKINGQLGHRLFIKTNKIFPKIHYSQKRESQWKQGQTEARITIRDIKKTGIYTEMTCISTTNPSELFILEHGIVTHNTRYLAAAAAGLSCGEIYDINTRKWVKHGGKEPTLYITTELEVDEVQTLFLAYLSGVNEQSILDGNYNAGEEERVHYAAKLLMNSPIWIEHLPNYNIQDIENTLRRYRISKGVKYCMFDYIHTTFKLLMEVGTSSKGMKLREDIILYILAIRLKDLCNELGMHISTATQVNAEWENKTNGNQNLLRASKAIADKIDIGLIALPLSQKDIETLSKMDIIKEKRIPMPNVCYHIYKTRRSKYSSVKLWNRVDLGTCRTTNLFLTDNNYNPIPIEALEIEIDDTPELAFGGYF